MSKVFINAVLIDSSLGNATSSGHIGLVKNKGIVQPPCCIRVANIASIVIEYNWSATYAASCDSAILKNKITILAYIKCAVLAIGNS